MAFPINRRDVVLIPLALAATAVIAFGDEPAAMPHDVEWRIAEIAGTPVAADSRTTISFGADGAYFGRACNSFRGSYTVDGDSLTLGPAAATRMACAEPLMAQESALFSALEQVAGFQLTRDGALWLSDAAGRLLIVAYR